MELKLVTKKRKTFWDRAETKILDHVNEDHVNEVLALKKTY